MSDFTAKMHQIWFRLGSAPDPAGGAYSAPPDPLASGEGAGCPFLRTPPPLSALRTSILCPPGYNDFQPGSRRAIINTDVKTYRNTKHFSAKFKHFSSPRFYRFLISAFSYCQAPLLCFAHLRRSNMDLFIWFDLIWQQMGQIFTQQMQ